MDDNEYLATMAKKVAKVCELIKSMSDKNELISTSVNWIRDEFNYYYVGLYLMDNNQEYFTLQAGTGKAGQIMISRRLRFSQSTNRETSILGWVLRHHKARIALDVGENAIRFKNPWLPDAHSEIMLPLGKEQLVGILDIQSSDLGAFSDKDIPLLQPIANERVVLLSRNCVISSVGRQKSGGLFANKLCSD